MHLNSITPTLREGNDFATVNVKDGGYYEWCNYSVLYIRE